MAGNNDIRQKIVLEGEKEYSAALKEAQRNLKVLRSELKAETAELGKNATAQEKNQAKVKSLQKQIKEQEKIVRTYESALKEVKEKYGDNAEAVAKWEVKLNEARATLGNMRSDLDNVGNSFKNIDNNAQMGIVAAKSFADSLQSIGSAADSIAGALESAFTGVLGVITDAVTALWDEVMKVSAKANAWTDLADYFGTTAENVQKWSNAIQGAGGKFDDFTTILNKFKTGGVNKKITEWFGVSDVNYTDDLEYTVAVMRRMVALREEMTAAGTWDKALADIFGGRKSQAAGWFVSNWANIEGNLGRYDAENGGIGMTSEELETMNQLYIDVLNIQTTWQAFKDSFLAGAFGKLSLDLAGNAQGILDGLIAFMGAENDGERNAAIKQIENNMTSFFTRLGEAIEAAAKALDEVGTELAGSENGYVAMIGKALKAFSDALEWLTKPESLEQVKNFFEVLFGLWVGAKAASALANIAAFATNIGTIVSNWGHKGVQQALGGAAASGGGGILSGIGATAAKVIPIAAGVGLVVADSLNNHGDENQWTEEEIEEIRRKNGFDPSVLFGEDLEDVIEDVLLDNEYTDQDRENAIQDWWDAWRTMSDDEESALEWMKEVFGDDFTNVWDRIIEKLDEAGENQMNMEDIPSDWWIGGGKENGLSSEDINGFRSVPAQMRAAVREGVSGIKVTMDGYTVGNLVAPYVSEYVARYIV